MEEFKTGIHTPFVCINGVQIAFEVPIYTSWLRPGCMCYWGSMVLVEIEIECVEIKSAHKILVESHHRTSTQCWLNCKTP